MQEIGTTFPCKRSLFSRYVVGWMVADGESAELDKWLIRDPRGKQGIEPGQLTIQAHLDSLVTSKPVEHRHSDSACFPTDVVHFGLASAAIKTSHRSGYRLPGSSRTLGSQTTSTHSSAEGGLD